MPTYQSEYRSEGGLNVPFIPNHNLLTIAGGTRIDFGTFSAAQKVQFFDTILALGLRAQGLPADHLRDAVDPSHIFHKDLHVLHEQAISALFHGLCLLMENTEDALVFAQIFRDTKLSFQVEDQPHSVIASQFYTRLPPRVAHSEIPDFNDATRDFVNKVAVVLPAFLNQKSCRRRFPSTVSVANRPFAVTRFVPAASICKPTLPFPRDSIEFQERERAAEEARARAAEAAVVREDDEYTITEEEWEAANETP
ncbi:hypothetical protein SCHPADRAFT_947524 [Schizopora paradoxa]|uniref:Uncharacterized protein n=1 Tax=Schizopora paradoxa TaxID=27342 RepID=A0A0H2R5C1_9AGAM|nr:hypothetical protein SCHPADRAFT_947524 [Schizopora paradoxa]